LEIIVQSASRPKHAAAALFNLRPWGRSRRHPTSQCVPTHVQSRLKDIGYVKEVLGASI
jgi:hypothetical protein